MNWFELKTFFFQKVQHVFELIHLQMMLDHSGRLQHTNYLVLLSTFVPWLRGLDLDKKMDTEFL